MVLLSIFGNLIGNLFGSDSLFEDDSITPCFRPGVILDAGISWVQFLRRFLIGGVAVGGNEKLSSTKCDQVCRASELPIYIYENKGIQEPDLCPPPPTVLERTVGSVRRGVWTVLETLKIHRQNTEDYLKEGTSRASSMVKYLSEESDDTTRMGAVGIGALTGYLLGMRRGFFRRLLYSSTGALAMCALCYPKQTSEYSQLGIAQSKKYAKITYNFIYGVNGSKKEGEEFKLPQLPSSLDDAWQMIGQFSKSASALITGNKEITDENQVNRRSIEGHVPAPEQIIQNTHNTAEESCDCPISVCRGRHDQSIEK